MRLSERLVKWFETGEGLSREDARLVTLVASGCATDEQVGANPDLALETKTGGVFTMRSSFGGPIKAGIDEKNFIIPWVLSDATRDRMGDRITTTGWDHKNFDRNPVGIWGHDRSGEPVFRNENLRVEDVERAEGGALPSFVGDYRFAVNESDTAGRLFRLAKGGFLNASSVGFLPKAGGVVVPKNDTERAEMDLGPQGVLFTEKELLENSLVSVPANANAIQAAMKSGALDPADAELGLSVPPVERQLASLIRSGTRALHPDADPLADLRTGLLSMREDISLMRLRLDGIPDAVVRAVLAALTNTTTPSDSPEVQSSEAADRALSAFLTEFSLTSEDD